MSVLAPSFKIRMRDAGSVNVIGVRDLLFSNGTLTDNGSGNLTYAAPSTSPAGTSGQLQYNNAGAFAGVAGSTVGSTVFGFYPVNLLMTPTTTGTISLTVKGRTGQTAPLQLWTNSTESAFAYIAPDCTVYAPAAIVTTLTTTDLIVGGAVTFNQAVSCYGGILATTYGGGVTTLTVRGYTSQTVPLIAIEDSALNTVGSVNPSGNWTLTPSASTSGVATAFSLTGAANTGQTASTEAPDVYLNLARTVTFATGALTTQRAVRIAAPTYAFAGASTITTAATLSISGPPVAGTNATLTNPYALLVETGNSAFTGNVVLRNPSFVTETLTLSYDGTSATLTNGKSGGRFVFATSTSGAYAFNVNGTWKHYLTGTSIKTASDSAFQFSSNTNGDGTADLGLYRNAASVLEVNTGTAGVFGGLRCGSPAAGTVGLIVKGTTSQSADLFQIQNSVASNLFTVDYVGNVVMSRGLTTGINFGCAAGYFTDRDNTIAYVNTNTDSTHAWTLITRSSTKVPFSVQGASGQTADLQQWQDSSGATVAYVNASGVLTAGGSIYGGKLSGASLSWGNFVTILTSNWANGTLPAFEMTSSGNNGTLGVYSSGAANKVLIVKGATSQTGDLQEWQNISGTVLAKVDSSGNITGTNLMNSADMRLTGFTLSRGSPSGGNQIAFGDTAGSETAIQLIHPGGRYTSGGLCRIQPANAAVVPLTVKAATTRAATVSNKALTSNVATLTTSSAHGFFAGETVVVAGVDATFDGTFTIVAAPTTVTFTYAKTAADVASTAATGTATVSQTGNLQEWRAGDGTLLSTVTAGGTLNVGNSSLQGTAATFKGNGTNDSSPGQLVLQATGVSNQNVFIDFYTSTPTLAHRIISVNSASGTGFYIQRYTGSSFRQDWFIDNATGKVSCGNNTSPAGQFSVYVGNAGYAGLVVQAATSQTANLLELQNSSGTVLTQVDNTGFLKLANNLGIAARNVGNTSWHNLIHKDTADTTSIGNTGGSTVIYGSGVVLMGADNVSQLLVATQTTPNVLIKAWSASSVGLVVRGYASQTADLQQWQNSAGTVLGWIAANGTARFLANGTSDDLGINIGGGGASYYMDFQPKRGFGYGTITLDNPNGLRIISTQSNGGSYAAFGVMSTTSTFYLQSAASVGVVVKGATSQTANLLELQNSSGTALAKVDSGGTVYATTNVLVTASSGNPVGVGLFSGGIADGVQRAGIAVANSGFGNQNTVYSHDDNGFRIQSKAAADANGFKKLDVYANTLNVYPQVASAVGLVIKGFTSQSANLLELQNSSGTALFGITSAGVLGLGVGNLYLNSTGTYVDNAANFICGSGIYVANSVGLQTTQGLFRASFHVKWTSGSNYYDTVDLGLKRSAFGVLQVTDGASGYGSISCAAATGATVGVAVRAATSRVLSVSNKALTSNVATLTTSAAHGFFVGESVVVAGVDATFNGTFTIVAVPTTVTFTYAKTAADVASTAATGTATVNQTANIQEWQSGAGTALAYINKDGQLIIANAGGTGTGTCIGGTDSRGVLTVQKDSAVTYGANTDPTDTGRYFVMQNNSTANTQNQYSNISLQINPGSNFSGGRCLADFRLIRETANQSNCFFLFGGFRHGGSYTDWMKLGYDSSWFAGSLGVGMTSAPSAQLQVVAGSASTVGAIVKGATSQTADLFQAMNSSSVVGARINAACEFSNPKASTSGETFGAGTTVGDYAVALGKQAVANATGAIAIGYLATTSTNANNIAIGNQASAATGGSPSFAIGATATTSGSNSIVIGHASTAGGRTIVLGHNISVSGAYLDVFATGNNAVPRGGGDIAFSSNGSPAILRLQHQSSTSTTRDNFTIAITDVDNTDASRKYRATLNVYDTAARECIRVEASGTAAMLGLFGVNAVVQPATTGTTTGFTAGAGTAVDSAATFTGGTGAAAYTIGDVVLALKQLGVLAA